MPEPLCHVHDDLTVRISLLHHLVIADPVAATCTVVQELKCHQGWFMPIAHSVCCPFWLE